MLWILLWIFSQNDPVVVIVVNDSLYPYIQDTLELLYITDLKSEGYDPKVVTVSYKVRPESLRTLLRSLYDSLPLKGALFIGKIPVVWFYSYGKAHKEGTEWHNIFPFDYYYMDLDGEWEFYRGDSVVKDHGGNREPEIWVARLPTWKLKLQGFKESYLLNNYFLKLHKYREREITSPPRALLYWDLNQNLRLSYLYFLSLHEIYWWKDLIISPNTTLSDYKERILQDYEWLTLICHGSTNSHLIGGKTFTSSDLLENHSKVRFYFYGGCSSANYTGDDCIGCWYLLDPQSEGLIYIGPTTSASIQHMLEFNKILRDNNTFGEAFKQWFSNSGFYDPVDCYPFVFLGDPTLRLSRDLVISKIWYEECGFQGDSDNSPDPGETLNVYIQIKNQTQKPFLNLSAIISSEDTLLKVLISERDYGRIEAGESICNKEPYRIFISKDASYGSKLPLDMEINANGKRFWDGIFIKVEKKGIHYVWHKIVDSIGNGNGFIEPGEIISLYVDLYNDSSWCFIDTLPHLMATGVHAILRSLDPAVQVLDSISVYGIIPYGERKKSVDPFVVSIDTNISNRVSMFEIEIKTNEGFISIDTFSILIGKILGYESNFEDEKGGGFVHHPVNSWNRDQWHLEDFRAYSGKQSWHCGKEDGKGHGEMDLDCGLITPIIKIDKNFIMSFYYYSDVYLYEELGTQVLPVALTGLIVEADTGDGWHIITPEGGYPSVLYNSAVFSSTPYPCFGNADKKWKKVKFPLSSFEEKWVRFRLRVITFYYFTDSEGFYIDNFYVGEKLGIKEDPTDSFELGFDVSPSIVKDNLTLSFTIQKPTKIKIKMFNSTGALVSVLYDGIPLSKENHIVKRVSEPCGVYFINLETKERTYTKKILILH